jgi:hypothetical protein
MAVAARYRGVNEEKPGDYAERVSGKEGGRMTITLHQPLADSAWRPEDIESAEVMVDPAALTASLRS